MPGTETLEYQNLVNLFSAPDPDNKGMFPFMVVMNLNLLDYVDMSIRLTKGSVFTAKGPKIIKAIKRPSFSKNPAVNETALQAIVKYHSSVISGIETLIPTK